MLFTLTFPFQVILEEGQFYGEANTAWYTTAGEAFSPLFSCFHFFQPGMSFFFLSCSFLLKFHHLLRSDASTVAFLKFYLTSQPTPVMIYLLWILVSLCSFHLLWISVSLCSSHLLWISVSLSSFHGITLYLKQHNGTTLMVDKLVKR